MLKIMLFSRKKNKVKVKIKTLELKACLDLGGPITHLRMYVVMRWSCFY